MSTILRPEEQHQGREHSDTQRPFMRVSVHQAPGVLHVDERLISGEARGVAKLSGQRVIGGSRNASNVDAFVKVEVVSFMHFRAVLHENTRRL